MQPPPPYREQNGERGWNAAASDHGSEHVTLDAASVTGESVYNADGDELGTDDEKEAELDSSRLLKRTNSDSQFVATRLQIRSEEGYPRHLSFSLAERAC